MPQGTPWPSLLVSPLYRIWKTIFTIIKKKCNSAGGWQQTCAKSLLATCEEISIAGRWELDKDFLVEFCSSLNFSPFFFFFHNFNKKRENGRWRLKLKEQVCHRKLAVLYDTLQTNYSHRWKHGMTMTTFISIKKIIRRQSSQPASLFIPFIF